MNFTFDVFGLLDTHVLYWKSGTAVILPVHSTEGRGLPVALQRNSARLPCWTVSVEG